MKLLKAAGLVLLVLVAFVLLFGAGLSASQAGGRLPAATVPKVADPLTTGQLAAEAGEYAEAVAYLEQVSRGDRNYSRAQRFIGWEIYTKALDRPRVGLAYVNRSIAADPVGGNVWQDAARTYGRSVRSLFR